jgi:3D (Asp-Asp-Asp) domain-containing protein/peptidoglycan hydrolase CwlO-like protein
VVGWRPVGATPPRRFAPLRVALVLATLAALVAATGAAADRAARLRSTNADLAAQTRGVLLELYALDSALGRAERKVTALRSETQAVERRRRAAQDQLALVKQTLGAAESRLALRLRQLYMESDPDPLAVLLGASSLEDAVTALENLGQFAEQDREIIGQVTKARASVRSALDALAAREADLHALTARAVAARSTLLAARAERSSYLSALEERRRFNRSEIVRLASQADQIETKAATISSDSAETGSPSISTSGGASPPPLLTGDRRQMTVSSTGYCLQGMTATGMPVGWGVIAVDPSVIPLGTRMTIPGYGEGVAADTGSAVRGATIDLWFPACAQAAGWGRQTVTITLH